MSLKFVLHPYHADWKYDFLTVEADSNLHSGRKLPLLIDRLREHPELMSWLRENMEGRYMITGQRISMDGLADATKFKLVWCT